jgi:hypothetical protein
MQWGSDRGLPLSLHPLIQSLAHKLGQGHELDAADGCSTVCARAFYARLPLGVSLTVSLHPGRELLSNQAK